MDGEDFGQGGERVAPPVHLEMVSRGRVEVISGVARRRRWSAGEKAQITRESFAPGASVSDVARRHGMSLGLLHHWRRVVRRSAEEAAQSFVPVVPAEENDLTGAAARPGEGMIEIAFCGASIRLRGPVDGSALRAVLAAVRGA
jgi:transposase